jgi:hypothetical protein
LIVDRFTIQGDPNIPAAKVSIKADLTLPLVLTLDQQDCRSNLEAASEPNTDHPLPDYQPFKIPTDWESDTEDIPKSCSYRYLEMLFVNQFIEDIQCFLMNMKFISRVGQDF